MIKNKVSKLKERLIRRIEIKSVKGYYKVYKINPDLINEIRNEIANHQIVIKNSVIENSFFSKNTNIQLVFHQYLLSKLLGTMFNRIVLFNIYRNKKIIYPLPIAWLKIIENSGLKVSYFWSVCCFYLFVIFSFLAGIFSFFQHLFTNSKRVKLNQKYTYFFDLNHQCFPSKNDDHSYDVISWYSKIYQKTVVNSLDDKVIVHSVSDVTNYNYVGHDIVYARDHFPRISLINLFFKFIPATIYTILIVFFTFRIRNIILLKEIIDMYVFKFGEDNAIADHYFFSFTNLLYRPLWTYTAEEKEANLIFYFYACNISNYKEKFKKYSTVPEFFQVFSWPKYLVWNNHHAEYINKLIKYPSDIEVVGPIGYQDSPVPIEKLNKPALLVFDIQPFKLTYSIPVSCGAQKHRYDYKVRVDFYNDIHDICNELGIDLFFKRKKNNPRTHKGYMSFIKSFIKNDNVFEINPDVSAFRLCKKFDVVLSMPFTSTAVIADFYGKKSIYYDPSGKIQKDDRASHNLNVINGKFELREYLFNLYNEKGTNAH